MKALDQEKAGGERIAVLGSPGSYEEDGDYDEDEEDFEGGSYNEEDEDNEDFEEDME